MLRGSALLLGILSYRRGGSHAPVLVEPSPGVWGGWAARQYALVIRLGSPPPEYRHAAPVWNPRTQRATRPLAVLWKRQAAYLRKMTAYLLWSLANERVPALQDGSPDPDSPWFPQAQRWADTYFRLPGGDIPDTPGRRAQLDDLRCAEDILRLTIGDSLSANPPESLDPS